MHIAFLTSEYPHKYISNSAGIGTSIKNLAHELTKMEHKVTVFVYGQNESKQFSDDLVSIHKIEHRKYFFLGWFLYRKKIEAYVNKYIKKENIQLLEAPDWTGITAFMRLKCPLLIRLHGSDTYFCAIEKRKQKLKNYFFEWLALKRANHIVSVSQFTATKTLELFHLNAKITVLNNGIDTNLFSPLSVQVMPYEILYFGTLIRKKGVLELAEIFNEVVKKQPNAHLILLGADVVDVIEKQSTLSLFLNKLSDRAKHNIKHIAQVPYAEVQQFIGKASVIVLPSLAEAFPMTWLEAMAMEKALVTSNIGWANELMVNDETGYTENPKNHIEFANKIVELLNNTNLNSKFGKQARQHIIAHFSKEIISKANSTYYKLLINE